MWYIIDDRLTERNILLFNRWDGTDGVINLKIMLNIIPVLIFTKLYLQQ